MVDITFPLASENPFLTDDCELEKNWRSIRAKNNLIWREWFLSKIDKILDQTTSTTVANHSNSPAHIKNVTVIFGYAGSGKTFLIQLLSLIEQYQNRILSAFFCKSDSNHTSSSDFIEAFQKRIESVFSTIKISQDALPNQSVEFRENLLKSLKNLNNDSKLVDKYELDSKRYLLLVDSIDLRPDLCDLISSNLHAFPKWLHVIITARPKRYKGITKMFSGARKIVIDDIKKTNVYNDMMSYLCKHKHKLTSDHLSKPTLNKIINKSNGCLLYVKLLLDLLHRNIVDIQKFDFVGATLNGLYLAMFLSFVNAHPDMESILKQIMSLFCSPTELQLTISHIQQTTSLSMEKIDKVLSILEQHSMLAFSADKSSVILVHSSLYEWLSDVKHCTSRFICHSSQVNPSSEETSLKVKQNLNSKYINDNEDSVNDISDDMLHDKEGVELSNYNIIASKGATEGSLTKEYDKNASSNNFANKAKNRAQNWEGVEASTTNNVDSSTNQMDSTTSNNGARPHVDDECLIDSDEEHFDEQYTLSKQDVSKEYLKKLYQKFENALYLCDLKVLCSILNRYSNVIINQSFIDGKTPLYWAIKKGNMKLVELFIEYSADVNAICDVQWGYTPLIVALMQHSHDMVELLLENDADVELLDRYSIPPILHAILVNCSVDIIKLLLYWGAHTDYIDDTGRSLLHFAANELKTCPETINLLLVVGCDEMHRDNNGQTALHMAASNGSLENVEVLIEFGGDKLIHTQDKAGMLPLHEAVSKNNFQVCECLITPKSINVLAFNGSSPLRIAVLSYHIDLAQLLILKGAEINYLDADGRSILYCVVAFSHSTLVQKGPPFFNVNALYNGEPSEYLDTAVETIEFLARFGIDLELHDLEGRTSLHVAAWQGTYPIVKCLIKLGANINAIDNEGRTPLHMCAWNGHFEVVRLLIDSGANVNHVSSTQGATPLLVAAQQGHLSTCSLLLNAGSKVDHMDLYGRNACDVAVTCGHTEIVTLINNFSNDQAKSRTLNEAKDGLVHPFADGNGSMKLSKYDPRFYNANQTDACNSVPNKKGFSSRKNKKTKSISKLTKILH